MKKQLQLRLLFIVLMPTLSQAQTKHTMQVCDGFFNPASLKAKVNDAIAWDIIPGSMEIHTTTSTTIPPGAPAWDQLVNTANPTFQYVVLQPGIYNYVCTPHAPMMSGILNITTPTAIDDVANKAFRFSPNPAQDFIEFSGNTNANAADVSILNMEGKEIKSWKIEQLNNTRLDIHDLPNGLYVISVHTKSKSYKEKIMITH